MCEQSITQITLETFGELSTTLVIGLRWMGTHTTEGLHSFPFMKAIGKVELLALKIKLLFVFLWRIWSLLNFFQMDLRI